MYSDNGKKKNHPFRCAHGKCLSTCTNFRQEWLSDRLSFELYFFEHGWKPKPALVHVGIFSACKGMFASCMKQKAHGAYQLKNKKQTKNPPHIYSPSISSLHETFVLKWSTNSNTFRSSPFVTQGRVCCANIVDPQTLKWHQFPLYSHPTDAHTVLCLASFYTFHPVVVSQSCFVHSHSTDTMLKPCSFSTPARYDCFKTAFMPS